MGGNLNSALNMTQEIFRNEIEKAVVKFNKQNIKTENGLYKIEVMCKVYGQNAKVYTRWINENITEPFHTSRKGMWVESNPNHGVVFGINRNDKSKATKDFVKAIKWCVGLI